MISFSRETRGVNVTICYAIILLHDPSVDHPGPAELCSHMELLLDILNVGTSALSAVCLCKLKCIKPGLPNFFYSKLFIRVPQIPFSGTKYVAFIN
jgi:hypothetical protein